MMLKKLYANPLAMVFICVLVIVAGIVKFFGLPIALYPDTSRPVWSVDVNYEGMDPLDFRQQYGNEIDAKLKGVPGNKHVEATYYRGYSHWEVTFDWNHDQDLGKNDIRAALSAIEAKFPKEWGTFNLYLQQNSNAFIFISLYSPKYAPDELAKLLEDRVKSRLDQIDGLEFAFVSRPFDDQVEIRLKPESLAFYGIFPQTIRAALLAKEYNRNLGRLKVANGDDLHFSVPIKDESLQQIAETPITSPAGVMLKLRDLADVSFASKPPTHLIKGNGQRGLIVGGKVKNSGNIAATCNEFAERVGEGARSIDASIKLDVLVNPSLYIQEAIDNIGEAVLSGILIATLVIFLFLSSLRLTLIIAIAIPLSLIGGFIVMSLTDIELNLISLGAMALACGMVVDGSVVVLENISRHLQVDQPVGMQARLDTIYKAVKEVNVAVFASLLTTIIVFAPLAYTAPLANAILGDLAKVMVCVLIISTGVTLITVPPFMLILRPALRRKTGGIYRLADLFQAGLDRLKTGYLNLLAVLAQRQTLRRGFFVSLILACLGSIYILHAHVRREILAEPDTDKVWLNVNFAERKHTIEEADAKLAPIEAIIKNEFSGDLTHFFTQVHEYGASILCNLKDKHEVTRFKARLEKRFKNTPTIHYVVSAWSPSALEIPHPPLLRIRVTGEDDADKRAIMRLIEDQTVEIQEIGHVSMHPTLQQSQQWSVHFNNELLDHWQKAQVDLRQDQLEDLISYALDDHDVKKIMLGGEHIPVRLGFVKDLIHSPNDLGNLLVGASGHLVPLRHFMSVTQQFDWDEFYSEGGHAEYKIEVFLKESFASQKEAVRSRLRAAIADHPGIPSHKVVFDDPDAEINESISSLLNALGLALALVWLVVILQFASLKRSLIVMSAIPLGLIGVALALAGFSSTLSVNSMLGLILLAGTAVNNSIIFVDFYEQLGRAPGPQSSLGRILETAALRFRPILITTATNILGMLPIAFGYGSGGEILQPLGIAVCGGLGISTCLTLLVVPLLLLEKDPSHAQVHAPAQAATKAPTPL